MAHVAQPDTRVAVIGASIALPGAGTLADFERLVFAGEDAFSSPDDAAPPRDGWVDRAGYMTNWQPFDYRLYGLSLRDSIIIDPQQRLFIQHCWKAAESAGYYPKALPARTAVISTASDTDYVSVVRAQHEVAAKYHPFEIEIGSNKEQQSLRVSHVLNLRGPSYGVQSACSSGLLVIHSAMQALKLGDCDLVLAGGASLPFPLHDGYTYHPGMNLSRSGVLRSFDRDADGMVPGFGCIVFVLKRLDDARRDGDALLAVLRDSRVNNDGSHKATYTSPSSAAIAENLEGLLARAGLDASYIDFVEAHGSGTYIGDVIEAAALRKAFAGSRRGANATAVASVKSSIGHLDTVAGLAGLLRAAVQARRQCIAPAANHCALNPRISFDNGPLYVPQSHAPATGPLTGIVNSLGIGGTNCAVLVESPPVFAEPRGDVPPGPLRVCVGASTPERVAAMMRELAKTVRQSGAEFRDVARTLNRRAAGSACVACVTATDLAQLAERLDGFDGAGVDAAPDGNLCVTGPDALIIDLGVSEIDPGVRVEAPEPAVAVVAAAKPLLPGIEQDLADIWKSALMLKQVSDATSFVDEGGHSMLALTMVSDINNAFDIGIDLDWIDTHDRFGEQLRSIAALLAAPTRADGRLVKRLRAASSTPRLRLVLVHASISGAEVYQPLAAHLSDDIELLAIDSYNLYADEGELIRSADALAALYAAQIAEAAPDIGVPLCIGGWSLGGMLANLIAVRLAARYPVAGLIAIDSVVFDERHAPLFEDDALPYFIDDASLLVERFGEVRYERQLRRLSAVFRVERDMARAFRPALQALPFLNIIATGSRLPIADGPLRRAFDVAKADNGWGGCPHAEIVRIDAHHVDIVEATRLAEIAAHVNRFAEALCIST
ncbi:beta-ketoacyl synthase N-terminal-like domain-containing protein [Burkholderia ubonensis]|uniref:beta-ketoacyl synthase N-terminal-like domain-containing protein n=1 Tax=Burkholderia ubonensis TaxID=101571 RepID=UPI0009B4BF59|nr:beta-ketoacyl synthase N-terminal-like domain-containing protein [Burkholderia ubonensis]